MLAQNQDEVYCVKQIAALCNVNRATVGYWIRSNKLCAIKTGKDYSIPIGELILFLRSSGRQIPREIASKGLGRPSFGAYRTCWQYRQSQMPDESCEGCIVYNKQIDMCFTFEGETPQNNIKQCGDCQYYIEVYLPRIQFIHQFSSPAFVCKDLYIIGGNQKLSELCGFEQNELIGMGIERLVHLDSLEMVIYNEKRRALDDSNVPINYNYYVEGRKKEEKIKICASVCSLSEPYRAFLVSWKII